MNDLRITFIQTSLHWENIPANLAMFTKIINALRDKTDLIILPEMFSTGFSMKNKVLAEEMHGRTLQWMKETARRKKCVMTGSFIVKVNGRYYNRLVWMRPNGKYETYDKRHLFRYAGEQNFYSAGKKKLIVELKGWKISPIICYDLRFPVWIRNRWKKVSSSSKRGVADYDLLLVVANWPERRNHPWKTLLMARAMENLAYVAGVNRIGNDGNGIYHSGDSAILNFKGEAISKTRPHKASVETVTLSRQALDEWRAMFPAWMDADHFVIKK